MSDDIIRHPTMRPSTALSLPSQTEATAGAVHELLAFTIADECYALPLQTIREILKAPPITAVPRSGHDILGIISVRGRVTTVIDLRRRLRMPEGPIGKHSRVLLVDDGEEILGALVDSVLSVYRLLPEEVELAAAVGGETADYVMGIGRPREERSFGRAVPGRGGLDRDDIIIMLDPETLLRS